MNRPSLPKPLAAQDTPERKLSPAPPETGRNGESGPQCDADAKSQTVDPTEVASTAPSGDAVNFHHPPASDGDKENEAPPPTESQPIDEVNGDDETAWDQVLGYLERRENRGRAKMEQNR